MIDKTTSEYCKKAYEEQIGRIKAVIGAADEMVARARTTGDAFSVDMAKSTAYDHIKKIVEEVEE